MKIGNLIKEAIGEKSDVDANGEIERYSSDNSVFVLGYNAVTPDVKYLFSCFSVEVPMRDRAVAIEAKWELANPREPLEVEVFYCEDADQLRAFSKLHTFAFRDKMLNADGLDREMSIGLSRCKGYSNFYIPGGVRDQIQTYYSRYAATIVAFIEGKKDYDKVDLSYSNGWGSWA